MGRSLRFGEVEPAQSRGARSSFAGSFMVDREVRYRWAPFGRGRRARLRLSASIGSAVPRHQTRLLADGRGGAWRLSQMGLSGRAHLHDQLRGVQGAVVESQRSQLFRARVRSQPAIRTGWNLSQLAAVQLCGQSRCHAGGDHSQGSGPFVSVAYPAVDDARSAVDLLWKRVGYL